MAARDYTYAQALEKQVKILYASIIIGAVGAVSSVKGNISVTRTGTGVYRITLSDKYNRLLSFAARMIQGTANTPSGIFKIEISSGYATLQADQAGAGFSITCYNAAEAPTDPVSGSVISLEYHTRNTTVSIGND